MEAGQVVVVVGGGELAGQEVEQCSAPRGPRAKLVSCAQISSPGASGRTILPGKVQ